MNMKICLSLPIFAKMLSLLALVGAIVLILAGYTLFSAPTADAQGTGDICLARWEWVTEIDPETLIESGRWTTPFEASRTGTLDLRNIAEKSTPGGLGGWGFFSYSRIMNGGMHCMGGGANTPLTISQIKTIFVVLGLDMNLVTRPDSVGQVIRNLYANHADITGITRWRPIRVSPQSPDTVFGGEIIRVTPSGKDFQNLIDIRWHDYRRHVIAGTSVETLRRWNGYDMLKLYGRMGNDLMPVLVPPEAQFHGWEPPATTNTDNFNRVDADPLGTSSNACGDWVEVTGDTDIVSNRSSQQTNGTASNRLNCNLSSDDHYAQVVVAIVSTSGTAYEVAVRFDTGATTYYAYSTRITAGTPNHAIVEVTAGTPSTLVSDDVTAGPVGGETIYLEVNGSTLTAKMDTVQILQTTDGSITGNLQAGTAGIAGGINRVRLDNFEEADLTVGGLAQVVMID